MLEVNAVVGALSAVWDITQLMSPPATMMPVVLSKMRLNTSLINVGSSSLGA